MKVLLTLFVLLFSTSVVAENISDFQIEGISLGDSALDYFEKKELKEQTRTNKSKIYDKYCSQKFTTYENGICFYKLFLF